MYLKKNINGVLSNQIKQPRNHTHIKYKVYDCPVQISNILTHSRPTVETFSLYHCGMRRVVIMDAVLWEKSNYINN